ncbi:origin recognition complex subunit 6-like [Octopus vulgaris]|uniref:Origin recognition complex subunit 6-like n=1 Tax=Octopus vulgaris TaxID=6645 RepID=A0AA36AGE6_OCTVU|nr:origin recognition complex subunit 6-like [Octopus vulgaris]
MLQVLGTKLGLTSVSVLKYANEICRKMESGPNVISLSALRLSQSCKCVIALDLAANKLGCHLKESDKSMAIKLSGLNKKAYLNSFKAVESLLGEQQKSSIRELCVQFGCTDIADVAQETLNRYQSEMVKNGCADVDFRSTLFLAAAVEATCLKYKYKIDRLKLRETCSVKKTVFLRLVEQLTKYAEDIKSEEKVVVRKKHRNFIEEIDAKSREFEPTSKKALIETKEPALNYEEWKRKILETATKAESEN